MSRRDFVGISAVAAALGLTGVAAIADAPKEIRIGYQKNGILVVARQQAALEKHFEAFGIAISWIDFPSGPPMLEAMNAGSVDFGQVGDTPPIFAQAAGAKIVYVAGQPITNGQGILVKPDSAIRTLPDLKGKRIGFTKGSSAHNVVVMALEKAGLQYNDITPVYLSPPDGAAAFARDAIDAWAIWDPYFAIGQVRSGGRVLVNASEIGRTNSFYIANRDFAARTPQLVSGVIDVLTRTAVWAEAHSDQVGRVLADVTGVDLDIQTIAAQRSSFAIGKVTDDVVATQQAVADRFFRLGLIPRQIAVREAIWTASQS
ncbi:MAG TPA: sulfonate ABC transporter substrate-binding protein [Xanthobacteraceae bacterium]|nr:sulfonate ABC transporter substrate-binding protein [Xanthobacteraceae bacterium]